MQQYVTGCNNMQKRYSTEYSLIHEGFTNFGMTVKNRVHWHPSTFSAVLVSEVLRSLHSFFYPLQFKSVAEAKKYCKLDKNTKVDCVLNGCSEGEKNYNPMKHHKQKWWWNQIICLKFLDWISTNKIFADILSIFISSCHLHSLQAHWLVELYAQHHG